MTEKDHAMFDNLLEVQFVGETQATENARIMLDSLMEVQFVGETEATEKDSSMLGSSLKGQFMGDTQVMENYDRGVLDSLLEIHFVLVTQGMVYKEELNILQHSSSVEHLKFITLPDHSIVQK